MHEVEHGLSEHYRRIEPVKQENPELTELAYRMQHAVPNDPELTKRLVYLYAADIYRWIDVLLYYRNGTNASQFEILSILKNGFSKAMAQVNDFHGEESISVWLFGIAYTCVRQLRGKNHTLTNQGENNPELQSETISPDPLDSTWESLDRFSEKLRSTIILRYMFDFEIAQIASILNIRSMDVHHKLVDGRKRLIVNPSKSHRENHIQSYADGLLDENLGELNSLHQHIETCDACQNRVIQIEEFEKSISGSLRSHWKSAPFGDVILNKLVQAILDESKQPASRWKLSFRLPQVAWILGIGVAFVGMSIIFVRITKVEEQFQKTLLPPTQQYSPYAEILSSHTSYHNTSEIPIAPQYIAPAFSNDGNWAVFAVVQLIPTSWRRSLPTIQLYNRSANTIQVISKSDGRSDRPWIWWDLSPGISGDGRIIAYVSVSQDPDISGEACLTAENNHCLDVFLYERESGQTKRLTQAVNGGPADGDSLAPTVSEDGHWVAFWSTADNLVEGFTNKCQRGETRVTCLYIYLYNLETGNIEWIPIPTIPGDPVYGVDRISLSADGRYAGFTVTATSQLGNSSSGLLSTTPDVQGNVSTDLSMNITLTEIKNSSEAIIYDRETGTYEHQNQTQDGSPGDAESSSPVLSSDGRYVAFTSASTNLAPGDTNDNSDVFLRDRSSGDIELISISSAGENNRSDSGLSFWGRGYYSLNISTDGRYVIFESTSASLGTGFNSGCKNINFNNCNYLYVHDRKTGATEFITSLDNRDFTFFPEITSDGRWVTFMQSSHACSPSQFLCSKVMLYDRQHKWMTDLTRNDYNVSKPGWSFSDSVTLPWQTWESTAFAFSPDGKFIALGGTDSKVRIWQISGVDHRLNNDEPSTILAASGNELFSALTYSKCGKWLAAGTTSGSVYIWRSSDGKLIHSMLDQPGATRKLSFAPDGSYLVFSTLDGTWVWNIEANQVFAVANSSDDTSRINAVDISGDGTMLVTARSDGSVWIQELPVGNVIGKMNGNRQIVSNLAISEDGSLLAIRTSDGLINVWQVDTTDPQSPTFNIIKTFHSYVYDGILAFSPDNNYLASSGMAGDVTLWSLPEGEVYNVSSSGSIGIVYNLAFSNDGDELATVFENEIVLWALHAESSSLYYVQSITDRFINSDPLPTPTANDIPDLQPPNAAGTSGNLTLDQVASIIYFPLIIPIHLPENITFSSASISRDGSILLRYEASNPQEFQASLYIYEKYIGDASPPTMTVGIGADIIPTQIETPAGGAIAEYVHGDWIWNQTIKPIGEYYRKATMNEIVDWDFTSDSQRLRWQQDGVLIAIYYQVFEIYKPVIPIPEDNDLILNLSPILDQADLEQIATGMLTYSDDPNVTEVIHHGAFSQNNKDFFLNINSGVSGQYRPETTLVGHQNSNNGKIARR